MFLPLEDRTRYCPLDSFLIVISSAPILDSLPYRTVQRTPSASAFPLVRESQEITMFWLRFRRPEHLPMGNYLESLFRLWEVGSCQTDCALREVSVHVL